MLIEEKKRKGMTLVEVILSISIFTMVMGGFTGLFMRLWDRHKYAVELNQSVILVSQGLGKMENYIRGARQSDSGAYTIVSASDNDLVIYSDYDNDGVTERLHFYKNGLNVLMGVREPSGTMPKTYANGDAQVITLATSIINPGSHPIFTYYDANYPTGTDPLSTPASVSKVRLVRIYLQVNINPYHAPDNVELQSIVNIRNINDQI
jgi:prepilin-type N-terminal cleavage/methylation domain-containing protein